jgi:hypothetical protein
VRLAGIYGRGVLPTNLICAAMGSSPDGPKKTREGRKEAVPSRIWLKDDGPAAAGSKCENYM